MLIQNVSFDCKFTMEILLKFKTSFFSVDLLPISTTQTLHHVGNCFEIRSISILEFQIGDSPMSLPSVKIAVVGAFRNTCSSHDSYCQLFT